MPDQDDATPAPDPAQDSETAETDPTARAGYAPSRTEVSRSREQGLGVGQSDIDAQRDPTAAESSEEY